MSRKRKENNLKKLFDSRADITTNDSKYYIRKTRVYICKNEYFSKEDYYGKVYTIASNKYNKNNVHIIREFYDNDQKEDRLRFRILNLKNAKKFKTIEKLPDGRERKIAVIEDYDEISEYICSIGHIKNIKSDTEIIERNKILKLVLPKDFNGREEDNKKVA